MDPRHPEQAVSRLRDLLLQYNSIESEILKATTTAKIGQLEREGGLVVQEMCLVAPRIHEAMMQTSRQRRRDLSRGLVNEKPEKVDITESDVNEIYVAPNQAETVIAEPKPRKKKTTKKKKAE